MTTDDCIKFTFSSPFPSVHSPPQMICEEQTFETQFLETSNQIVLVIQL